MNRRLTAVFLPILALYLVPIPSSFAANTVPGEEWETTVKMSMPGMPMQMPARTSKFCRAKDKAWDAPPMDKQTQDQCKITDYKLTGNHATWKVTCQGGMSGTGDLTYQTDSYAGTITMSTEAGDMKMDLSGRKTGTACDAMENVRTAERMQRQAAEAQEYAPGGSKDPMIAACSEGAASGNRALFMGPDALCKKPEQKAAFCKTAVTQKAFETYTREGSNALSEVATFCGTSVEYVRKDLCKKAVAAEDLLFLANHCEEEARPFAEKLCAGRKFTSIADDKTRGFCAQYAGKLLGK